MLCCVLQTDMIYLHIIFSPLYVYRPRHYIAAIVAFLPVLPYYPSLRIFLCIFFRSNSVLETFNNHILMYAGKRFAYR